MGSTTVPGYRRRYPGTLFRPATAQTPIVRSKHPLLRFPQVRTVGWRGARQVTLMDR
jgi:hypothetical protein